MNPAYEKENIDRAVAVLKYIRYGVGGDGVIAEFWGSVARKGAFFSISTSPATTQGDSPRSYTAIVAGRMDAVTTRYPTASLAIALACGPEVEMVCAEADWLSASGECPVVYMPRSVAAALGLFDDEGEQIGENYE